MTDDPSLGAVPDTGERMLLVEDNEVNQIVALGILGQLGYTVDLASNGQEALAMAESAPYVAVFMDCELPEMDGYQVARRWRERERQRAAPVHTPIIAMTASALPGDRERCLAAGMDDYIAKPLRRDTVGMSLSRWLGSAIDREQIDELRGQSQGEPLTDIVESFLVEGPALLDELAGAVARGDTPALPPLAHGLKVLASTSSATAMTELCATIGAQGREGDLPAATATLVRLRAEYDRARAELERIAAEP